MPQSHHLLYSSCPFLRTSNLLPSLSESLLRHGHASSQLHYTTPVPHAQPPYHTINTHPRSTGARQPIQPSAAVVYNDPSLFIHAPKRIPKPCYPWSSKQHTQSRLKHLLCRDGRGPPLFIFPVHALVVIYPKLDTARTCQNVEASPAQG